VQGIGTGERIIRTTERPAHVAKNRLNLPDEISLDYGHLRRAGARRGPAANAEQPVEQGVERAHIERIQRQRRRPELRLRGHPGREVPGRDHRVRDEAHEIQAAGSTLQFTFKVIEGEYKGRLILSRLNLDNPNATTVKIARAELLQPSAALVGVPAPKDSNRDDTTSRSSSRSARRNARTPVEMGNVIKGYAKKDAVAARGRRPRRATTARPPWEALIHSSVGSAHVWRAA
jgi:hypothetical protein